jgi:hypothetical protein
VALETADEARIGATAMIEMVDVPLVWKISPAGNGD